MSKSKLGKIRHINLKFTPTLRQVISGAEMNFLSEMSVLRMKCAHTVGTLNFSMPYAKSIKPILRNYKIPYSSPVLWACPPVSLQELLMNSCICFSELGRSFEPPSTNVGNQCWKIQWEISEKMKGILQ